MAPHNGNPPILDQRMVLVDVLTDNIGRQQHQRVTNQASQDDAGEGQSSARPNSRPKIEPPTLPVAASGKATNVMRPKNVTRRIQG